MINELTSVCLFPQREQCQIVSNITDTRIRTEYRCDSCKNCGQEKWLSVEFDGERNQIQNGCVQLECVQEQQSKMFEHFGEKVPEQANVGLQITMVQSEIRNSSALHIKIATMIDCGLSGLA